MLKNETKLLKAFLLFAFFGLVQSLSAQNIRISGKITEASTNDPIIGATVTVKGSPQTGTITDFDGKYIINANKNATLVYSYVGYTTKEIPIKGRTNINVSLKEATEMLDEVVAIGYSVQKKKELTGAVSQVKSDELLKSVGSDFTKALQGKVSGLSVTESSGRPGDNAVIQIRGLGSISGNISPLYVVDGIPADGNPNLPAEEIESVDVLKDGASAAVYGSRAANGVILITTKHGQEGKTKVSFSGYYGIQNIVSGTQLLNTAQHIYVDEFSTLAISGVHSPILHFNPTSMDYDTDFVGAVTNDNAPLQNYNVQLNGGSKNLTFNINSNYFKQDGILINSGYERFSNRANAQLNKGDFSAFVSMGISHSNKSVEPWRVYQFAQFQGPYRPPLKLINGDEMHVIGNNPDQVGYLASIINNTDKRSEDTHNISTNLKYKFFDCITYQINLGYNYYSYVRNYFQPKFTVYDMYDQINSSASRSEAILQKDYINSDKLTLENILSFDKTFKKHKIGILLGYTIEKSHYNYDSFIKQNFMSNETPVFDSGSVLKTIAGNKSTHSIIGKLFRLQYTYNNKYMLSASGRYDGSSRFSKDNRYAFFPGASIGWNINEEKFLKKAEWLSNLKLRASYGEVGNEGIGDYRFLSYVKSNVDYVWGPETNDQLGLGAIQRSYANSDIKWETNISRNIGLDLTVLNGALTFSGDVYKNNKKNMLLDVMIPASTGTNVGTDNNTITSNVGNMVNKGFELSATYKKSTKYGLKYSISGTFTKNKNEITSLGSMSQIAMENSKLGSWMNNDEYITYMKVGYPAGSFWLVQTDGIIKTQADLDAVKPYMPNAKLGDFKIVNQNGDNKIDDNDRVYKGSAMPKFETSMVFDLGYKNIDFSAQLFYSDGNKVYNGAKQFAYAGRRHLELYDMWTPQNSNSNIPVPNTENVRQWLDYFLENGSFLRIRNLTLGYTLPKTFLRKLLSNARIYVSAQNPFTFTKYEGYDPEVGGDGISTRGVDKGNYPITRKFLMGVQLDF